MKNILLVDDLGDALAMLEDAILVAFGPLPCTLARSEISSAAPPLK